MTQQKCAYESQIKGDGKCPVRNDLCEYNKTGKCLKVLKEVK